jgi:hypothetical protein
MTKLQQVNKIVIKMLKKHRKESRNVAIDRKFTKKYSKNEQLMNKTLKYNKKMQRGRDRLLGVLHNISENTVGENHY